MPEAKLFVEKRAHPRFAVTLAIKYRLIEDRNEIQKILERRNQKLDSRTLDLSLGGMYLVSREKLNLQSILNVEMTLPGETTPFSVFAEVVWNNETGVGLHFITIREPDLERLKAYLDSRAKD
ncbi:MAG TPA: PilZ domain-containing protein [bacterium]|nr:PilZ domain-containing protein [bacterium]